MRKAVRFGSAAALAVTLFIGGAIVLHRSADRSAAGGRNQAVADADVLLTPSVGGSLEETIANLQSRLRSLPSDWRSFASLGLAYVQQARVSGDPSYYPKAEGVLQTSIDLHTEDNFEAMVGMAALSAARHDFEDALTWGREARAINPYNGNVYGVIGDAQVELGRYDDAFRTFQRMVDTLPGVSSYARVSYARELRGDVAGAIAAMDAARSIAGTPADAAWASYQLGELRFGQGALSAARDAFRRGTELDPNFVPSFAGLAKVAWARGDLDRAIGGYAEVVARYPLPEYVIALGDLYRTAGRPDDAARQYALVRVEEQLFRSNGVNIDLELALFDADHGHPRAALRAARAEWRRRRSVHVADAYAWALYVNGRFAEADAMSRRAMALGYRNALFAFHAGMIRLELGDRAGARRFLSEALAINPHFSIGWAPVAAEQLVTLGGAA